ncbi:MAG: hypothetical protein JSS27_21530 [Planctomycetes bacterium]|nr:hypothetical protein [Planctomycetota bacterium]
MAKSAGKSKSSAVRDALTAHPEKSPAEIAKETGAKISLVYNVKSTMGKTKKRKKKSSGSAKASVAPRAKAPHSMHSALDSAFEYVVKVGGLIHAEELLAKLKKLKERL